MKSDFPPDQSEREPQPLLVRGVSWLAEALVRIELWFRVRL